MQEFVSARNGVYYDQPSQIRRREIGCEVNRQICIANYGSIACWKVAALRSLSALVRSVAGPIGGPPATFGNLLTG